MKNAMKYLNRHNPLTETQTPEIETRYSKENWCIVSCPETGMVYLKNPPDYDAFEEDYAWEKQFAEQKQRRKEDEPVFSAISDMMKKLRTRYRKRESIERESEKLILELEKYGEPLSIIDIGCGVGTKLQRICHYMKEQYDIDTKPIGIEISVAQAEQANTELEKVNGYCIQNNAIDGLASVEENSLDLIILCSFLEHEMNPMPLLRNCKKKLKKHGLVLIKVPNYACQNRKFRQEKWCGFRYPDHVNYYTPDTLNRSITRAGLTVRKLKAQPFNDNMWAVASLP